MQAEQLLHNFYLKFETVILGFTKENRFKL